MNLKETEDKITIIFEKKDWKKAIKAIKELCQKEDVLK